MPGMTTPLFVDIHTHHFSIAENTVSVRNLMAHESFSINPSTEFFSIGIHPWFIEMADANQQLKKVEEYASGKQVIALGECGIDRIIGADINIQIEFFTRQVELSEMLKKPLIIHAVKAVDEILQIRKNLKARMPWIFHRFNLSFETAKAIVKQGCYVSLGANIFKKTPSELTSFYSEFRDSLFFETDDHHLPISELYQQFSTVTGIELTTLKTGIFSNFKRIFPEL